MTPETELLPQPARERGAWLPDLLRLGTRVLRDLALAPFYALYRMHLEAERHAWKIPQHIGIIMDGNRRFARSRGLAHLLEGHARGAEKLDEVLNWCEEAGVRVITVWIFSMDNFQRDPTEVNGLMDLFEKKFLELVSHPRVTEAAVVGRPDAMKGEALAAFVTLAAGTPTGDDFKREQPLPSAR